MADRLDFVKITSVDGRIVTTEITNRSSGGRVKFERYNICQ